MAFCEYHNQQEEISRDFRFCGIPHCGIGEGHSDPGSRPFRGASEPGKLRNSFARTPLPSVFVLQSFVPSDDCPLLSIALRLTLLVTFISVFFLAPAELENHPSPRTFVSVFFAPAEASFAKDVY